MQFDRLCQSAGPLDPADKKTAMSYLKPSEIEQLYKRIADNKANGSIEALRSDPDFHAMYALAASYTEDLRDAAPALRDMENSDDEALQGKLDTLLAEWLDLPDDARRWFSKPCMPVTSTRDLPRLMSSPDDDIWTFHVDPERKAFIETFEDLIDKTP